MSDNYKLALWIKRCIRPAKHKGQYHLAFELLCAFEEDNGVEMSEDEFNKELIRREIYPVEDNLKSYAYFICEGKYRQGRKLYGVINRRGNTYEF